MIGENGLKTVFGSLFHDIGKVIYRSGGSRKGHSESGYEYLKEAGIQDEKILNCVRYHHNEPLKNAPIKDNDYAYIVYYADNIASFTDRREVDTGEVKFGFDQKIPLDSVFNLLNGNHGKSHYEMRVLNPESDINYPTNQPVEMDTLPDAAGILWNDAALLLYYNGGRLVFCLQKLGGSLRGGSALP